MTLFPCDVEASSTLRQREESKEVLNEGRKIAKICFKTDLKWEKMDMSLEETYYCYLPCMHYVGLLLEQNKEENLIGSLK